MIFINVFEVKKTIDKPKNLNEKIIKRKEKNVINKKKKMKISLFWKLS
jgi:hypothetical protein